MPTHSLPLFLSPSLMPTHPHILKQSLILPTIKQMTHPPQKYSKTTKSRPPRDSKTLQMTSTYQPQSQQAQSTADEEVVDESRGSKPSKTKKGIS